MQSLNYLNISASSILCIYFEFIIEETSNFNWNIITLHYEHFYFTKSHPLRLNDINFYWAKQSREKEQYR
jgi:hypothetical protein